jgi:hypothetical protein
MDALEVVAIPREGFDRGTWHFYPSSVASFSRTGRSQSSHWHRHLLDRCSGQSHQVPNSS